MGRVAVAAFHTHIQLLPSLPFAALPDLLDNCLTGVVLFHLHCLCATLAESRTSFLQNRRDCFCWSLQKTTWLWLDLTGTQSLQDLSLILLQRSGWGGGRGASRVANEKTERPSIKHRLCDEHGWLTASCGRGILKCYEGWWGVVRCGFQIVIT